MVVSTKCNNKTNLANGHAGLCIGWEVKQMQSLVIATSPWARQMKSSKLASNIPASLEWDNSKPESWRRVLERHWGYLSCMMSHGKDNCGNWALWKEMKLICLVPLLSAAVSFMSYILFHLLESETIHHAACVLSAWW